MRFTTTANGKIHRAGVSAAHPHHMGSSTLDEEGPEVATGNPVAPVIASREDATSLRNAMTNNWHEG